MKKIFLHILVLLITSTATSPLWAQEAAAQNAPAWSAGNIISDEIFTKNNSMSFDEIQRFLNSKVPTCDTYGTQTSEYGGGTRAQWGQAKYGQSVFTCLKDYKENGRSAAQIIYDSAREFNINPQVLIVLLQKEQGLVTDTWPLNLQYRSATGYGCPDTAACDSQYYGLTNQLRWAARMFRAIMNNTPTWYTPYVLGNNYIQYNPVSSCGGTTVNIVNRATQALYNYTPYQPNQATVSANMGTTVNCGAYGNINFFRYFTSWFGSTRGDYCTTSLNTTTTGILFGKDGLKKPDNGKFMIYSGSSTGCIESHGWNNGFGTWNSHISTNSSSINLNDSQIHYADIDGDGRDEAILVGLRNTGSGKIEFHVWNPDLRSWKNHIISNSAPMNPAISQISFADLNGDGKDEAILIGLVNGSTSTGKIEFHVWNEGFGSWKSHHISNSSTLDSNISQLSFADLDGNGKDEGVLIGLAQGSTSTGKIEFHVWNEGFGSWKSHTASNENVINPAVTQLSFADLDGNGKDEGVLIGLRGAGTGSGNIEFHVWNEGFGSWKSHHISNQKSS